MDKVFWVGAAIFGGLWLLRHLSAFNRRTCPRCKGTGRVRSGVFSERWHTCRKCGGSGHVRGWLGRPE